MATLLFVSLTLLVLTLGIRHYELARGGSRTFELTRTRLDRSTLKITKKVEFSVSRFFEYTKKDVVLNVLHMITYTALHIVRFIETRLDKSTRFLRSFKKREVSKRRSSRKKTAQSKSHNEIVIEKVEEGIE